MRRGHFPFVQARMHCLVCAAIVATITALATPVQVRASPYGSEYDAAFDAMLANPTDLDIAFRFAMIARAAGDAEGAVGTLERMLILNPALPIIHYELARLYAGLGSFEAARRYYRSALEHAPPPDVRANIEAQLKRLEQALQPSRLSGSVLLALRYQTNANVAPDDPAVRVGGLTASLADEFLEQDDASGIASARFTHSRDLGRDPAVFLLTDLQLYGSRQQDLDDQDINLVSATFGPRFGRPDKATVRPFVRGSWVEFAGETLYWSLGLGIAYHTALTWIPGSRFVGEAALMHRDFASSEQSPALDDRDGENYRANGRMQIPVSTGLHVEGFGTLERQDSRVGYESYSGVTVGLRGMRRFAAPLGTGTWDLSVSGEAGVRDHDRPDPTVDPDERRRDRELGLSANLMLPLSDLVSGLIEVRQQWRFSGMPNYEYDNTSILVGTRFAF